MPREYRSMITASIASLEGPDIRDVRSPYPVGPFGTKSDAVNPAPRDEHAGNSWSL